MSMNKKEPSTAATELGNKQNIQLNCSTISEQSKADYTDTLNDIEMYLARAEAAINEVVDGDIQNTRTTTFALIANDYLSKIREIVESAME